MSLRGVLAALLSSSFFFSGSAAASVYAPPNCTASYAWTSNSLNQSACTVAAYMMSTCNGGSFDISPLLDTKHSYTGPSGNDDSDLCKCNTIAYSLISACDACQGSEWISFPNPVPPGTSVPHWAFDVTVR
ncbi:hypothetical protein DFH94DRAFT_755939 [Russula ochroleuca]|uniref:Uncharacterized protein n=1 Tax=Russula ochroleuca TaxID=152965 RepID=A0A9P5MSV0_9AGAM|nr:hypothetical protein DFH94DRAFT_755939 [Russula ochroleuca]